MRKATQLFVGLHVCAMTSLGSTVTAQPIQWPAAEGGNDHYYELIVTNTTWPAARLAAEQRFVNGRRGYLTTITSAAENDFLVRSFADGTQASAFIGASDADIEGDWRWVTGPEAGMRFWQGAVNGSVAGPCGFAHWGGTEPNNAGNQDYAEWALGDHGQNVARGHWIDSNARGDFACVIGFMVEYGSAPFVDLGGGLAGTFGNPKLTGSGRLQDGERLRLALTDGRSGAVAILAIGTRRVDLPLLGGVLVPSPEVTLALHIDASGGASFEACWPSGPPAGLRTYWQVWVVDDAGPQGLAASNALSAATS